MRSKYTVKCAFLHHKMLGFDCQIFPNVFFFPLTQKATSEISPKQNPRVTKIEPGGGTADDENFLIS